MSNIAYYNNKKYIINSDTISDANLLHRDEKDVYGNVLPAIEWKSGAKDWWKYGKRHRDNDLPAKIYFRGTEWWKEGKLHRDTKDERKYSFLFFRNKNYGLTLPAINRTKIVRIDKFPSLYHSLDSKEWYREGKLHRDDKDKNGLTLPAIINEGLTYDEKKWYVNGKLHRTDKDKNNNLLPAVVVVRDGEKIQEWWIDGKQILDLNILSQEEKDKIKEYYKQKILEEKENKEEKVNIYYKETDSLLIN